MSIKTKSKISKISKIFAYSMFVFVLFTTVKITSLNNTELESGTFSFLGLQIDLTNDAIAKEAPINKENLCIEALLCTYTKYPDSCGNMSVNGVTWECWTNIIRPN